MRTTSALCVMMMATSVSAGPISKFGDREPNASFVTSRAAGDIERCLIDVDGVMAPHVYRQPDRPDAVQIIYPGGFPAGVKSVARVDLADAAAGTKVSIWTSPDIKLQKLSDCATSPS